MKIDTSAKEYILKKGGKVKIIYHDIGNTCIDFKTMPEVSMGTPRNLEKFYVLSIDSIQVFVDKFISDRDELTIKLNSVLGFKYLVLDGWKTI